jgi:cell division protein FtsB
MAFTVQDFDDMLKILEARPEWRRKMVRVLFPEIDLAKALQELAEESKLTQAALRRLEETMSRFAIGQQRLETDVTVLKQDMTGLKQDVTVLKQDVTVLKQDVTVLKQDVTVLKEDVSVLKQDVTVLKQDVTVLKQDVKEIKRDVGSLKGKSQETYYRDQANGVFGRYLRSGRTYTSEVADQLYDALKRGLISENEIEQVLAVDLIWAGEERENRTRVILLMEASWLAEINDVSRAVMRTEVLQRLGLFALPVVGGEKWAEDALQLARQQCVVITTEGRIDGESWRAAWAKYQPLV